MHAVTTTRYGFSWAWNVHQGDVPLTQYGRVYYVVDDFGNHVMVDSRQTTHSVMT